LDKRRIDLKSAKESVKKIVCDKTNIIKNIKAAEKQSKENFNIRNSTKDFSSKCNKKRDLNCFLRERYENDRQRLEKDLIIKRAEEQKDILENEIKSVEKLRNAFTDLLPKVVESIKINDNKETSDKNLITRNYLNTNNIKDTKFQETEIIKNTNINLINYTTNSNNRNNPVTTTNNNQNYNKITPSSRNDSNKQLCLNKNSYKTPAYEDKYVPNDIFYHPKKNYFVLNKYKKLLQ